METLEHVIGQAEVWAAWAPHFQLSSETEVSWDWALNLGLPLLQVASVRNELNC